LSDFYGASSSRMQYQPPSKAYDTGDRRPVKGNIRNASDLAFSPLIRSLSTTYRVQFDIKEQATQPPIKRQAQRSLSYIPAYSSQ
jgi:hypothetical protein